jgi:hypothetical protein
LNLVRVYALAVAAVIVTGGVIDRVAIFLEALLGTCALPWRWHGHSAMMHAWLAVTAAAHLSATMQADIQVTILLALVHETCASLRALM